MLDRTDREVVAEGTAFGQMVIFDDAGPSIGPDKPRAGRSALRVQIVDQFAQAPLPPITNDRRRRR
jgi:hypothetical protein